MKPKQTFIYIGRLRQWLWEDHGISGSATRKLIETGVISRHYFTPKVKGKRRWPMFCVRQVEESVVHNHTPEKPHAQQ